MGEGGTSIPSVRGRLAQPACRPSHHGAAIEGFNYWAAVSAGVSAWLKPSSNIGFVDRIVDHNGGCGNGWTFEFDNGFQAQNGLSLQLNSIDFPSTGNMVITIGKWQQVGFTDNAGSLTFYVNGVAVASSSTTPFPLAAGTDLAIGGRVCDASRNMHGVIDDVRIYNRALSPSEMYSLYKLGTAIINK